MLNFDRLPAHMCLTKIRVRPAIKSSALNGHLGCSLARETGGHPACVSRSTLVRDHTVVAGIAIGGCNVLARNHLDLTRKGQIRVFEPIAALVKDLFSRKGCIRFGHPL